MLRLRRPDAVVAGGLELGGELSADGVHVHPFHTVRYLREVALPALREGAAGAARDPGLSLAAPVFVVAGRGGERARAELVARLQIAFYASTRSYRPVLELYGLGDLQERLARLVPRGEVEEMASLVPPELLREVAVEAADWDEAAAAIRARYDGLLDRVAIYEPPSFPERDGDVARLVAALRG